MNKVLIIAEAGVNHNGSLDTALMLCDAAKKANVDIIKFQTWKTELVLTRDVDMADYQKDNLSSSKSQFDMAKELELSYDDFKKIKSYCNEIGIKFLSTPDDLESLNFLLSMGMDTIKVGSGEVNNIPFLEEIGSRKKHVILSTGMSNIEQVENAYNLLTRSGCPEVSILHCTTSYPCPMDKVNLKAMITLKNKFNCNIGYSDHTQGIEVSLAAVAMGARIIEKHFTLDKQMKGPDHQASISPMELESMVLAIRNIEKALGSEIKEPSQEELNISKLILRKIVAKVRIKKGEMLDSNNLTFKRTREGISVSEWNNVMGRFANKNYIPDEPIKL
tara:strand:+ start:3000 stop:3998 length:999 start_codon:yes stop_codon:yes gene_type:complete